MVFYIFFFFKKKDNDTVNCEYYKSPYTAEMAAAVVSVPANEGNVFSSTVICVSPPDNCPDAGDRVPTVTVANNNIILSSLSFVCARAFSRYRYSSLLLINNVFIVVFTGLYYRRSDTPGQINV